MGLVRHKHNQRRSELTAAAAALYPELDRAANSQS